MPQPCDPNPCENGGTCIDNQVGGYVCKCKPGFKGRDCDEGENGECVLTTRWEVKYSMKIPDVALISCNLIDKELSNRKSDVNVLLLLLFRSSHPVRFFLA